MAWITANVPMKLVSMIRRTASGEETVGGPSFPSTIPALLTRMSSRPWSVRIASAAAAMLAPSIRSTGTEWTASPWAESVPTAARVAERAGVSVGTMYQYFPHKQALFYALNERYLDGLAGRMEAACRANHGVTIDQMVEALVTTYWNAKTERPEVTRALYRSVTELDNAPLIDAFSRRVDAATAAMLATAPDAAFADPRIVNLTLLATVFGTVRSVFERNLPLPEASAVHGQLILMCIAYLEAVRNTAAQSRGR